MHTKDIEYAISMVAHPKAQTIRAKALAQLNSLLNRIVELEAAQQNVHLTCSTCGSSDGLHEDDCPIAADMVHQSASRLRKPLGVYLAKENHHD